MNKIKICSLFVFSFLTVGCMAPAPVKIADNTFTAKAQAFEVPKDSARVYFLNGKNLAATFISQHPIPTNLYVNNVLIGSLNRGDAFVFDVKPNTYEISWRPRTNDPIDANAVSKPYTANLKAGESIVLVGNYQVDFGMGSAFGIIGVLASTSSAKALATVTLGNRSDVNNKVIVLPESCPDTICVKN